MEKRLYWLMAMIAITKLLSAESVICELCGKSFSIGEQEPKQEAQLVADEPGSVAADITLKVGTTATVPTTPTSEETIKKDEGPQINICPSCDLQFFSTWYREHAVYLKKYGDNVKQMIAAIKLAQNELMQINEKIGWIAIEALKDVKANKMSDLEQSKQLRKEARSNRILVATSIGDKPMKETEKTLKWLASRSKKEIKNIHEKEFKLDSALETQLLELAPKLERTEQRLTELQTRYTEIVQTLAVQYGLAESALKKQQEEVTRLVQAAQRGS